MFAFRLYWDAAILSQFSICKLFVLPFIHGLFVGLPVRATPNQEISSICVQEDKMADGTPRRLCVSHSPLNGADFCGEGTGHFRSSGELTRKSIWNEHKIIAWSLGPMKTANNYLNTVFVDVVSLCLQDLQKQCPPTVPTRKALTCCNSLPSLTHITYVEVKETLVVVRFT